jgi:hypothetical protein
MKVAMTWQDAARRLTLRLAPGARMRPPVRREIAVRVAGDTRTKTVVFEGKTLSSDLASLR